jgi:predicted transcriptional regulator
MRSLRPIVTEGPRTDILQVVREHPGVHLRSIERRTSLPLGQVLYHLDRLERMGLVDSARDQGFRRYYTSDDISHPEKPTLAALRHAVPRRILMALLDRPGLTHKELLGPAGVAGSTLSFHLQRLVASGVLLRERVDASTRYHLADAAIARRELVYYRESFRDPDVDRYVRRLLDGLPRTLLPS